MDLEGVTRVAVAASATALLIVGVGVIVWEVARSRPEPVEHDRGPLAAVNFLGILGYVAVGLASSLSLLGTIPRLPGPADAIVRVVGIGLLAAAGALALWGLRSIGRQMASQAAVRPDTELVTGGAFGLVRHPLYLSILMLWTGGALALLSWAMAVCTVALIPLFVARSRLEEQLLIRHFGDGYRAYAARVPMLLPRLRRPSASPPRSQG